MTEARTRDPTSERLASNRLRHRPAEYSIIKYKNIIRVFYPRAGLHCKLRNQGCSSAQSRSSTVNSGTKVAVLLGINKCGSFPLLSYPTLFLTSEQALKDLKRSQGPQRGREDSGFWLTGHSGLHRNSPQGLNISFIRVFDLISDPEIPIILRP